MCQVYFKVTFKSLIKQTSVGVPTNAPAAPAVIPKPAFIKNEGALLGLDLN